MTYYYANLLFIESIIMQIYGVLSDLLLCKFTVYWVNYYSWIELDVLHA
jgi:hypothetical protein